MKRFAKKLVAFLLVAVMATGFVGMLPKAEAAVAEDFKVLFIGNSFTEDITDGGIFQDSMLYNIMKGLVGDRANISIGAATSGAKTLGWHATMAEADGGVYTFRFIDKNSPSSFNYIMGVNSFSAILRYTDWDAVVIQPYATEIRNGTDTHNETAQKFKPITASVPYLLDKIHSYNSTADVYLYLINAATMDTTRGVTLEDYNNIAANTIEAEKLTGTTSGKGISGIVPVGCATQVVKDTYLATLRYNYNYATGEVPQADLIPKDPQLGLQRDGVHLSSILGRYIANLTAAKYLIPERLLDPNGTEIGPRTSAAIGKLPDEYVEICKLAVNRALNSEKATANRLSAGVLPAYRKSPIDDATSKYSGKSLTIAAENNVAALETAVAREIERVIGRGIKADVTLTGTYAVPTGDNECVLQASVALTHGYTSGTINTTVKVKRGIEILSAATGSGTVSPEGSYKVPVGTNIKYTFTPDENNEVIKLTIDGVDVTPANTYTFQNVTETHTVSVQFAYKNPFADITHGQWFTEDILYSYYRGFINGMTPDTFVPDVTMSRAMLVTLIWRMVGEPEPASYDTFTDVAPDAWFAKPVNWAAEVGVVNGIGEGLFNPDGNLTREALAVIVYRYAKNILGVDVQTNASLDAFPDKDMVTYGELELRWATGKGIIKGMAEGGVDYLNPRGTATRAQGAVLLARFYRSVIDEITEN